MIREYLSGVWREIRFLYGLVYGPLPEIPAQPAPQPQAPQAPKPGVHAVSLLSVLRNIEDSITTAAPVMQTVAKAATLTEHLAGEASAVAGSPLTSAQKLAAGAQLATALDPALLPVAGSLETIFNAAVGVFNMLGIFGHASTPAPAPVVELARPQAVNVATDAASPAATDAAQANAIGSAQANATAQGSPLTFG